MERDILNELHRQEKKIKEFAGESTSSLGAQRKRVRPFPDKAISRVKGKLPNSL